MLTSLMYHDARTQTTIEFKSEIAVGELYFGDTYSSNTKVNSRAGTQEYSVDFSIGVTTLIHKKLYLGTSFGTNNFTQHILVSYPPSSEIYGELELNQIYIEVLPEIRFFQNEWLFFNLGFGLTQITRSTFTNDLSGTYYKQYHDGPFEQGSYVYDVDEFPSFDGHVFNIAANIGCRYKFRNIGLIGSLGYRYSSISRNNSNEGDGGKPPGVGFKQFTYKIGVSYSIEYSENE